MSRWWVQHETGELVEASQVSLADEPVTPLREVIEWWRTHRFEQSQAGAPALLD